LKAGGKGDQKVVDRIGEGEVAAKDIGQPEAGGKKARVSYLLHLGADLAVALQHEDTALEL
jgi:hypothetical protein